jgi:hypothetical protein
LSKELLITSTVKQKLGRAGLLPIPFQWGIFPLSRKAGEAGERDILIL